jgi:hypothetical protein
MFNCVQLLSIWLDGSGNLVKKPRIANPCTGVRFSYSPPNRIDSLHIFLSTAQLLQSLFSLMFVRLPLLKIDCVREMLG